jgi:Protein of unknown function (DUF2971)
MSAPRVRQSRQDVKRASLHQLSDAFGKARDSLFSSNGTDILYHFTHRDPARSILRSHVLWAVDLRKSRNDRNELSSGFDRLQEAITGSTLILAMGNGIATQLRELCFHAACLTSECGVASQWSDYAGAGTGWAIGFSSMPLNTMCINLGIQSFPINYDAARQIGAYREYLEVAEGLHWNGLSGPGRQACYDKILMGLGTLAFTSKNMQYKTENEWRLAITCDDRFTRVPNLGYCTRELPLCTNETIREVILGPDCEDSVDEVAGFLEENGYPKAVVRRIDRSLLR